jgi:hypothetical protein
MLVVPTSLGLFKTISAVEYLALCSLGFLLENSDEQIGQSADVTHGLAGAGSPPPSPAGILALDQRLSLPLPFGSFPMLFRPSNRGIVYFVVKFDD